MSGANDLLLVVVVMKRITTERKRSRFEQGSQYYDGSMSSGEHSDSRNKLVSVG